MIRAHQKPTMLKNIIAKLSEEESQKSLLMYYHPCAIQIAFILANNLQQLKTYRNLDFSRPGQEAIEALKLPAPTYHQDDKRIKKTKTSDLENTHGLLKKMEKYAKNTYLFFLSLDANYKKTHSQIKHEHTKLKSCEKNYKSLSNYICNPKRPFHQSLKKLIIVNKRLEKTLESRQNQTARLQK